MTAHPFQKQTPNEKSCPESGKPYEGFNTSDVVRLYDRDDAIIEKALDAAINTGIELNIGGEV